MQSANEYGAESGHSSLKPQAPQRRVSKSLLNFDSSTAPKTQVKPLPELTDEFIQSVFEAYKEKLRSENRSVLHAQFSGMEWKLTAADELTIISDNPLADEYARNHRNELNDYLKETTGHILRILTQVVQKQTDEEPKEQILSKLDVFALLASRYPAIQQLKSDLGLTLDY